MKVRILSRKEEAGREAAREGAEGILSAIEKRGRADLILATGVSQFEMLDTLTGRGDVDWGKVGAFHLDEYIGLPLSHPASFRRYLKERFTDRLPVPVGAFHAIDGEADPGSECARLKALISSAEVDVAFVGIGENGHLAFNDPPADFETDAPYLVVDLDEACRRQQLGEGWFARFEEVPLQAISMSIQQIMKSKTVICTVLDARKADAVQRTLEGPVTPDVPASILQEHPDCRMFLDEASASKLRGKGM